MSFQAYLDAIEKKTGQTPRQVGSDGVHRDESNMLDLDGVANRTATRP